MGQRRDSRSTQNPPTSNTQSTSPTTAPYVPYGVYIGVRRCGQGPGAAGRRAEPPQVFKGRGVDWMGLLGWVLPVSAELGSRVVREHRGP